MNFRSLVNAVLAAVMTCSVCFAQEYPVKPIHWIVGFPPGGGSDIFARQIGQRMSASMGQPIIVDNRGGAGGLIAAPIAAKSPADGYTLFACDTGTLVLFPLLYEKLTYAAKDFQPVTLYVKAPLVLFTNPSLPVRNVNEFIAYAKANPGKISYASLGEGTIFHLAMAIFNLRTGTQMLHVPYKATPQVLQDLVAGDVKSSFFPYQGAGGFVQSGKLRALAVSTKERVELLPEVPTIDESGLPGFEAYPFLGAAVPAGTPRPIVDVLSREIRKAMGDPELKKIFSSAGVIPQASTVAEFEEIVRRDTQQFSAVIKSLGLKLEL